MRVVSGELRGRRIEAPPGTDTRPTTDKVREATFNALGSLDLVRDALVVDLYAGSGAMGIEALYVEQLTVRSSSGTEPRSAHLRSNLEALGLEDRSKVASGDALVLGRGLHADLVLADPPYGFDRWGDLLGVVSAPFVVAESGRELEPHDGWVVQRSKRYGRTWVAFLERADDPGIIADVRERQ